MANVIRGGHAVLSFFVPANSFPLLGTIELSRVKLLNLEHKKTKRGYSTFKAEQRTNKWDAVIYYVGSSE
jgi:hypothetical protein